MRTLRMMVVALASLMAPGPAAATSVSPMYLEMKASGPRARAQVTVSNPAAEPIAIEPKVEDLEVTEAGKSVTRPGAKDFLVIPTQALVQPGKSQTFRVMYVGPSLAASRSYLLTMAQMPIRNATARVSVQVMVSFGVAINVAPTSGKPSLVVEGAGVDKGKAVLIVHNPSSHHALLSKARVALEAQGWSRTIEPDELSSSMGAGLVQPGKRRRFVLPVDVPPEARQLRAHVSLPEKVP